MEGLESEWDYLVNKGLNFRGCGVGETQADKGERDHQSGPGNPGRDLLEDGVSTWQSRVWASRAGFRPDPWRWSLPGPSRVGAQIRLEVRPGGTGLGPPRVGLGHLGRGRGPLGAGPGPPGMGTTGAGGPSRQDLDYSGAA